MEKKKKVLLSILGILIIGIFFSALVLGGKPEAILYIDKGEVLFDSGRGWQVAEDEMEIKRNYKIKTSENSEASIVIYGRNILRLEENTEIDLREISEDKISIRQEEGSTWNRILRLTGNQVYEVETPTSVASVRGTGFLVDIGEEDNILGGEGCLNVKSNLSKDEKEICEGNKATSDDEGVEKDQLSEEENSRVNQHMQKDIETLKRVRQKIIEDNRVTFFIIKRAQGWNDEDVQNYLDELDRGMHDIDELIEMSPIKNKAIEELAELTREIQMQML